MIKFLILSIGLALGLSAYSQRHMELLDRGLVAVKTSDNTVFLSWRLLASDDYNTSFLLYRQYEGEQKVRLTDKPILQGTNFTDEQVDLTRDVMYSVVKLMEQKEIETTTFTLKKEQPVRQYLEIPLRTPTGYTPGDASVGDLDGDGAYEIIVHQTGKAHDNAHNGITSDPIFQAYKLDGTFLWEINLGKNIREGAHYTQFMVYDLDGDGCAELICKTADGTKDGVGRVIGDAHAD